MMEKNGANGDFTHHDRRRRISFTAAPAFANIGTFGFLTHSVQS